MFKERLSYLRKTNKLTQRELSLQLGLEASSVGKYEGRYGIMPSAATIIKIAELFKVSVDYLFGITDDPTPRGKIGVDDTETSELLETITQLSQLKGADKAAAIRYIDLLFNSNA